MPSIILYHRSCKKKTVENWILSVSTKTGKTGFWRFSPFFPKRGEIFFFDLKFESRFEILSSLAAYFTLFVKILKLWLLFPHCSLIMSNGQCGHFLTRTFLYHIRNQRPRGHKIGWCSHRLAEKKMITSGPNIPFI